MLEPDKVAKKKACTPGVVLCRGDIPGLASAPQKLKHPLYEVHWVWGGSTLESKRQNMRDAMKFHDEPPYYEDGGLRLVSYDLDQLPVRQGSA